MRDFTLNIFKYFKKYKGFKKQKSYQTIADSAFI